MSEDTNDKVRQFVQDNLRDLTKDDRTRFQVENLIDDAIDNMPSHIHDGKFSSVSGDGWSFGPVGNTGGLTIHLGNFTENSDKDIFVEFEASEDAAGIIEEELEIIDEPEDNSFTLVEEEDEDEDMDPDEIDDDEDDDPKDD
jgi:hypothetical protein